MADLRRTLTERLPITGARPEQVARVVNALVDGYSENTGRVTLGQSDVSTIIRAPIFRASTVLFLVPLSEAAAEILWWIEGADVRAITVGHDAPPADVEFAWVAVG